MSMCYFFVLSQSNAFLIRMPRPCGRGLPYVAAAGTWLLCVFFGFGVYEEV